MNKNISIGCRVYKTGNVMIRARPFSSLTRQKEALIFLLDRNLSKKSKFLGICNEININYESFMERATAKKKPDTLRRYSTADSIYSESIILFYVG